MSEKKLHYFMVAGNVVVKDGDDIHSVMVNAILTADGEIINEHALGKAQQGLQVNFFNKMGATSQVLDVILVSIIPLGAMTEEQFRARPEGIVVQERATPVDKSDPFADQIADRVLAS